jgi:restriction endonuclease Mrr
VSANNEFRRNVLRVLRAQFRLEWLGIHGVPHWARVRALAQDAVDYSRGLQATIVPIDGLQRVEIMIDYGVSEVEALKRMRVDDDCFAEESVALRSTGMIHKEKT